MICFKTIKKETVAEESPVTVIFYTLFTDILRNNPHNHNTEMIQGGYNMEKYKDLSNPEKWIIKGIPAMIALGILMHYLYDITGKLKLVGAIAPINESIWEHIKLILLPTILWWTIYYFKKGSEYRINKNKWFGAALTALLMTLLLIPVMYYSYTGIFGVDYTVIDMLILVAALIIGQLRGLHYYRYGRGVSPTLALLIFISLLVLFAVTTFKTPELPIFRDPETGGYGI